MQILGVVPAKRGPKRIPKKNQAPLLGRLSLAWPGNLAVATNSLIRVGQSTDESESPMLAKTLGSRCPS